MAQPNPPVPTELRYDKAAHVLHVTFDNDDRFIYTAEFLRVHSPSAEVRGHGPGQEVLQVGKERVAIENIATSALKPWRVAVVFGFGLLHGLGFAGVLSELGMPEGRFLTALLAFNVGVELGQVGVVALAFGVLGRFRNLSGYRRFVVIPCSGAIAATGCWWSVSRAFG